MYDIHLHACLHPLPPPSLGGPYHIPARGLKSRVAAARPGRGRRGAARGAVPRLLSSPRLIVIFIIFIIIHVINIIIIIIIIVIVIVIVIIIMTIIPGRGSRRGAMGNRPGGCLAGLRGKEVRPPYLFVHVYIFMYLFVYMYLCIVGIYSYLYLCFS